MLSASLAAKPPATNVAGSDGSIDISHVLSARTDPINTLSRDVGTAMLTANIVVWFVLPGAIVLIGHAPEIAGHTETPVHVGVVLACAGIAGTVVTSAQRSVLDATMSLLTSGERAIAAPQLRLTTWSALLAYLMTIFMLKGGGAIENVRTDPRKRRGRIRSLTDYQCHKWSLCSLTQSQ